MDLRIRPFRELPDLVTKQSNLAHCDHCLTQSPL